MSLLPITGQSGGENGQGEAKGIGLFPGGAERFMRTLIVEYQATCKQWRTKATIL
ncbi:MAG: hypothetical protein KZQ81_15725 [Candidatus Thiodiazotropha sp. (ex Rostrolucina anterorostrata)]|nr:hypothetical protein [Candidatus Thiodiazotropha sp. (ex Rostrolucina anterorostrata)]